MSHNWVLEEIKSLFVYMNISKGFFDCPISTSDSTGLLPVESAERQAV
jgi:hypothetical protein